MNLTILFSCHHLWIDISHATPKPCRCHAYTWRGFYVFASACHKLLRPRTWRNATTVSRCNGIYTPVNSCVSFLIIQSIQFNSYSTHLLIPTKQLHSSHTKFPSTPSQWFHSHQLPSTAPLWLLSTSPVSPAPRLPPPLILQAKLPLALVLPIPSSQA